MNYYVLVLIVGLCRIRFGRLFTVGDAKWIPAYAGMTER